MGLFGWVTDLLVPKKFHRLFDQGLAALASGDNSQAERCFARALEMAEEVKAYDDIARASYELARAEELQNKNVAAEKHYRQAFQTFEDSEEFEQAANSLKQLARIYRVQRRLAEAESAYRYAIKLLQDRFAPEDQRIVELSKSLAECLIEGKAYPEAETLLKRVIGLCDENGAASGLLAAESNFHLGMCAVAQGNDELAEENLRRAHELFESLDGGETAGSGVRACACAHEYARCLVRRSKEEVSRRVYARALELAERHPGYLAEGELLDEASRYVDQPELHG